MGGGAGVITFTPQRGAILMCDFGPDPLDPATFPLLKAPVSMGPEMWKVRRVIVVSTNALNHKHAKQPGLCTVVPCSATPPHSEEDWDVFFDAKSYPTITRPVWAKCAMTTVVSHARLDRVSIRGKAGIRSDFLMSADMSRVEAGIRAALGL
jgi:uncharacterized protein YifN (PemK superfamily)